MRRLLEPTWWPCRPGAELADLLLDLNELLSSVAETITEESIGSCAAQMMEEWGEHSAMEKWDDGEKMIVTLLRCEDAYQPEEVDEMMELGMEVASYKCFQKIFNK